jgi:prepilin-type processing-associated H-X9-DG protein
MCSDWLGGMNRSDSDFPTRTRAGLGKLRVVPLAESGVFAPANLIAFGDSPFDTSWNDQGRPSGVPFLDDGVKVRTENVSFPEWRTKALARRHPPNWNMLFADGHIEGAKARTFFDRSSLEVLRRWNRDNQPHPEGLHRE